MASFSSYMSFNLFFVFNLAKMNKLGSYREIQNVLLKNYSRKGPNRELDIALVELTSPFKWSSSAKPACLPTSDFVKEYKGQLMVSFRFFLTNVKRLAFIR